MLARFVVSSARSLNKGSKMKLQFRLPSPEHTVQFQLAKSLSKEGWLMCPACGLPQMFCQGCCFDPACEPHAFKVSKCPHCGFDLRSDADPKAHDVKKGKAERQHRTWRGIQKRIIAEYEHYCRNPEYPDADGT